MSLRMVMGAKQFVPTQEREALDEAALKLTACVAGQFQTAHMSAKTMQRTIKNLKNESKKNGWTQHVALRGNLPDDDPKAIRGRADFLNENGESGTVQGKKPRPEEGGVDQDSESTSTLRKGWECKGCRKVHIKDTDLGGICQGWCRGWFGKCCTESPDGPEIRKVHTANAGVQKVCKGCRGSMVPVSDCLLYTSPSPRDRG